MDIDIYSVIEDAASSESAPKAQDRHRTRKALVNFCKKAIEIYGYPKITKEEAKAANLPLFWSGKPCSKGHVTYRYVCNSNCRQCVYDNNYKHLQEDPERLKLVDIRKKTEDLKLKREMEKLKSEYSYDF